MNLSGSAGTNFNLHCDNEFIRDMATATAANPSWALYGDGGNHYQHGLQHAVPVLFLRAETRQGRLLVYYRRPQRECVLLPLPVRFLCP